ncbi:MAG: hypothetical protein V4529_15755 [Gemmatimonadota bacterium]
MKTLKETYIIATCATLVCAGLAVPARAQNAAPPLGDYLRTSVGLNAGQIADAQNGAAVVKLLHTDVGRDVTVFGIIGIHTTRDAYLAHMRDVQSLIAARSQRFGIISDPPTPAELQTIALDPSEWQDLKGCRVRDCNFKLSESDMKQFAQVDWYGPNAEQQADSVMRVQVANLVAAYRARGNAAMPRYDDTNGVQASDAFAALLDQSTYIQQYAPALRNYLVNFPADRPENALDVMYWSLDRIPHLRPTFTLNQMVVLTPPAGNALIVRKQIYANHYFEAALELSTIYDAPALNGGAGIYLVTTRRYRFDALPGGFLNIRGRVRSQLQKVMKSDLERERKTVEARPTG